MFCARLLLTCVNLASNGVGRSWEKDQSQGDDNHAKDQKDGSVNPFEGVNATTGSCSIRVDATMGAAANLAKMQGIGGTEQPPPLVK